MREGDILVIWKLDHLDRFLKFLIEFITSLHDRHIGFNSFTENIDTTTPGGKLIFHMFGALAEFERGEDRADARRDWMLTKSNFCGGSTTRNKRQSRRSSHRFVSPAQPSIATSAQLTNDSGMLAAVIDRAVD